VLSFALFIGAQAQTLHVVMLVNESESGREIDRKADADNFKAFAQEICDNTGLKLNLKHKTSSDFTANNALSMISQLTVKERDVVIFYYSGHGYNNEQDKWPHMNLKDKNLWLSDVLKELNSKAANAKLIMAIADCCNKERSGNCPQKINNPSSTQSYKALFTDFKGKKTIIVSASIKGQYSYSHMKYGSFFANSFYRTFFEKTSTATGTPTWENIFGDAQKLTLKSTENEQEPQFDIKVRQSAFDED